MGEIYLHLQMSRVVVESREWVPPLRKAALDEPEKAPLSLIDATIPGFPIGLTMCFDSSTDMDTTITSLKWSLGASLQEARILAGELVLGERIPHVLLTDRGCELVLARCTDETVTRNSFNVENWTKLPAEFYGGGMSFTGVPLLQITLVTLVDNSQVLTAAVNHQVADLGALVSFIRVWSFYCQNLHSNAPIPDGIRLSWDRTPFSSDVVLDRENQPPAPLREVQVCKPDIKRPQGKINRVILRFTDSQIEQWRGGVAPAGSVSKNDVITVHTMRTVARARGMDGSESIRCFFPVDMRHRLGLTGYIGNCITYQAVDFTIAELLADEDSLVPLYGRVREAVISSDKEHLQRFVDWIASVESVSLVQQRWRGMMSGGGPDILLTSGSYLNRERSEALFAPLAKAVGGKLLSFGTPGPALDGYAISLNADIVDMQEEREEGGIVVLLGLKE